MTTDLIKATKQAIGYTEKRNCCATCKHFEIIDPRYKNSECLCTVNNLCAFTVNPAAICNKHQPK